MSIAFILRAIIIALSITGITLITVSVALSVVPFFYGMATLMVLMTCGLVAVFDL